MNNQENKDWRDDCVDTKSRGEKVLSTGLWADCRFLVGTESHQEEFSAHKLILAMASPVFEKMFYGNLTDKADPILIPDVTPDAFRGILEYIYADKIKIDSYQKAYELYYAATKYILPHIVKYCVIHLIQNLNPTNVCKTYEFAKLFDENILKTRCLQMISKRTKTILKDSNFMELEMSTLLEIFNLDVLNIESELDLLEALNNYANINHYITIKKKILKTSEKGKNSNEKQQSDNTIQKRNFIDLKAPIGKIRFLTVCPKQFSEILDKCDLLNESESSAIFMNISNLNSTCPMPNGFSTSRIARKYPSPPFQNGKRQNHCTALNLYNNVYNESEKTTPITGIKEEITLLCINTIRKEQIIDFEMNFEVDETIIIRGIKISSQVGKNNASSEHYNTNYGDHNNSRNYPKSYEECLYVQVLDSENTPVAYTHVVRKLNYDSIMEILFDDPIIQRNKMYKIGISFCKMGSYPMYTCHPEIRCDNVNFTFSVGSLNEPLKKGLINTILFEDLDEDDEDDDECLWSLQDNLMKYVEKQKNRSSST